MSQDNHSHFIVPVKIYVGVFIALLFLTGITVLAAQIDLGSTMNYVLAMAIATVKATLVALFFMGLRWDSSFNGIIFVSAIACLILFITLTFADLAFREDMDVLENTTFGIESPVNIVAPGDTHHGDDKAHH